MVSKRKKKDIIVHLLESFCKKTRHLMAFSLLAALPMVSAAQVKLAPDTLECHMVGFNVGLLTPVTGSSSGPAGGNMSDLYSAPYLDYGLDWAYKYQNGWMLTLDADLWFGLSSNNLRDRSLRQSHLFNSQEMVVGWDGTDGEVYAYNRGLAARPGVAYIARVLPKNPNSGILFKLSGGWFMQKTVFSQNYRQTPVPQLNNLYAKLYDHLRNGVIITESIGFLFMSNYQTYVNFKASIEVSQCFSWSSRPYQIDNLMGLNGKDNSSYFDLMVGLKLSWIFPFTGKTSYDYYYY